MRKLTVKPACFACTTPYQVMGAIGIAQALYPDADSDIYIFGMFPNYDSVAAQLRKQNVFSEVIAVDCEKLKSPGKVRGFLQMAFAENTVSFFLPKGVCYEKFYSSSRALPKTITMHVLSKRNPSMQRVIYEDGMGTYASNSHPLNATKMMERAEKLLGWNIDDPDHTSMLAYISELVDPPEYIKGQTVGQMPRLKFDSRTVSLLEEVFSVGSDAHISERIIIFDTLRKYSRYMDEAQFILLDECYDTIRSYAGGQDIICKPHPRSGFETKSQIEVYKNQEVPMEILYATMDDLEDRILISYTSSAVFTPKIMFDKEPVVLSLHRILNETRGSVVFEGIYLKFKGIYKDSGKVMAPENMDELKACLSRILNG